MSVDTNVNSQRSRNSNSMEVDTLQEVQNFNSGEETNFLEMPQNSSYR